ncbi:TonB-dependent receptor [Acetobacteraceae bacterium ESL0709]|nr:TonB-dependent receptor [Acetobacteraceae bacterium ESL0697]MDF7678876.1 TonB-dependent receptor [Acetobacteraceae bacterium ESL0709]
MTALSLWFLYFPDGPALAETPGNALSPSSSEVSSDGDSVLKLPSIKVRGDLGTVSVPQASSSLTREEMLRIQPNEPYAILRDLPGVFFQNDGTPALSVSIRGMQDFGRVNVMIDGARQNFQESGHGANGSVYVDPALLAGLDVTRGTVSTADGGGAIGGKMNLHTLDVDDIVEAGKHYGAIVRGVGGTNNYDGSGMVGFGNRINDLIAVAAAFSARGSGDYADGNGDRVANTFQHLQSGLFKIDLKPGPDQKLTLGTVIYHNRFGVGTDSVATSDEVQNNTGTIDYRYTPGDSKLISLHAKGYVVSTNMSNHTPSFQAVTLADADLTRYGLTTLGFEADNTSRFKGGPLDMSLTYGGEYYHDHVHTTSSTGHVGATPSGGREVGSAFTELTMGWSILQLTGAMRYDRFHLSGGGYNEFPGLASMPVGNFHVNRSTDAVSPKVTFAVTPVKGLQFYANYGLGFRPPAITETLYAGSHPGLGFVKFVPNPFLDPERTYGWEVGSKMNFHEVLSREDSVQLDADYYDTRIKNYVGQTVIKGPPSPGSFPPIPNSGYLFQNIAGNSYTRGFEGQIKYDSSLFFGSLSYTNTTTELANRDYTGYGQIVTTPPRNVMASTIGIYLLDKRLILGGRVRAATGTTGQPTRTGATERGGYVVFDLFGSYQITKRLQLFTSADNVTNRHYYNSSLSTIPNQGLTVMSGLTLAFSE